MKRVLVYSPNETWDYTVEQLKMIMAEIDSWDTDDEVKTGTLRSFEYKGEDK